jgi:hypothetical protein
MCLTGSFLVVTSGSVYGAGRPVQPGQSIQAAIDAARPGDTVEVGRGVFHENVVIRKDGITLRGSGSGGDGTVIEPAATGSGTCGPSAVCVLAKEGNFPDNAPPQVITPVHDVQVTNLQVRNAPDTGVLGLGADRLRVDHVNAVGNGGYGIARFISENTEIDDNRASGSGEAGIYVGDSPDADTHVEDNVATDNGLGFFVRDSSEVDAERNESFGNCVGMLVLDTGETGPADDMELEHNRVHDNDKACPASEEGPPFSGIGIALAGGTHIRVEDNRITDNRPGGPLRPAPSRDRGDLGGEQRGQRSFARPRRGQPPLRQPGVRHLLGWLGCR